ncbi:MAG TPA: 7TM diverse intracellular signaling domain-containing protein [Cytophagaceae bacterium]
MRKVSRLFLIAFLLQSISAIAGDTLILEESTLYKEYVLEQNYIDVILDKEGKYTFPDIQNHPFHDKLQIINNNQDRSATYWIRFRIKNQSREDRGYLFETYSANTENLELYVPLNDNKYIVKHAGELLPFSKREYLNKNIAFDLPVGKFNETKTYYVKVKSNNFTGFDFRIKSNNYFVYYSANEYFLLGSFYGMLVLMAIYNILLSLTSRKKVYLYYVLYVLSGILFTLAEDRVGLQYLWPSHPELNPLIGFYSPVLLMIAYSVYSLSFLELGKYFKTLNKFVISTVVACLILYLTQLWFPAMIAIREVFFIPFLLIYIVAIYTLIKGRKSSRYFIIGSSFILVSVAIIVLRLNLILEPNFLTVYSLYYGLVAEIMVFSLALADRMRLLNKEKEDSQNEIIRQLEEKKILQEKINRELEEKNLLKEKVNRELEQKVRERTIQLTSKNQQLEEANQKLKELTEQVNEMNVKLDLHNWKLVKDVKEAIKARIFDKKVSFEDFSTIFPNENSCYQFLEDLKWGEHFECRKCKNAKYINSKNPFLRKCTKCGYAESVTAYTIFHGVRFPINKAFYLFYITCNNDTSHTIEELCNLLSISKNTCWSFKNKVKDKLEAFQKKSKKYEEKNWEKMIVDI